MTNQPLSSVVETFDLSAGQIRPIDIQGDFFLVVETSAEIEVSRTGSGFNPYAQGDGEQMPEGQSFRRIEVRNPNAAAVRVSIFAGFGRRIQNRQSVIEPKTRVKGWSGNLAANSGRTFPGTVATGDIRRKAVVVTNGDATSLRLQFRDGAGIPFNLILPGESAILPLSESVELYNPNPVPVTCYVGEIFWTV